MRPPSPPRAGFTLVELLVVITVIAILAALTVAGATALGIGSKRAKSATIVETVRQALELAATERGGYTAPAEHPLAGSDASAGPRFRFQRSPARVGGADGFASATMDSSGVALAGVSPRQLASAFHGRLLDPDDRYADPALPALYGMPRSRIGVVGAAYAGVTRYRRLSRPQGSTSVITDPDDTQRFPDDRCLVISTSDDAAAKENFEQALSRGNALAELAKLRAIWAPDPARGAPVAYGRAWSEVEASGGDDRWKPGRMIDPQRPTLGAGASAGRPRWVAYRLRGPAVYDAWGVEILYSMSDDGVIRLISAGRDGAFRWDPGQDDTLGTTAFADGPGGDDRDGAKDNVEVSVGGGS